VLTNNNIIYIFIQLYHVALALLATNGKDIHPGKTCFTNLKVSFMGVQPNLDNSTKLSQPNKN